MGLGPRIACWRDGAIGYVRLDRPERRNAVDVETVRQVADAIERLTADGVHVGILAATGPVFCAGGDRAEAGTGARSVSRLVELIADSRLFWAARVQGPAVGGGVALAAVCPLTVLTPSAWFQLPEISQGFVPTAVLSYLEPILGPRRALQLCLSNERIEPQRVVALGLAEAVVAPEMIDEVLVERLRPLAASPTSARAAMESWRAHFATPAFRERREALLALLP